MAGKFWREIPRSLRRASPGARLHAQRIEYLFGFAAFCHCPHICSVVGCEYVGEACECVVVTCECVVVKEGGMGTTNGAMVTVHASAQRSCFWVDRLTT
jgi:hypothetical protein